jgi:pyruvate ferredoxin oxidoreductase beta subunit/2-oxoisovalerate ferredoxin oxidoreductase beta subunit
MATVSAAAERNEDILYVCYDNEIYGNTGGQRSSATPLGAATTTTPRGKQEFKKDILAIMAAHRIPYCASISLANPDDTLRKMHHAVETRGFRFLHILSPCPTGWKSEPSEGIELIRLAVKSGLYPVYEIRDGREVEVNVEPEFSESALETYVSRQGRFRKAGVEIADLRVHIDRQWKDLWARAER